MAQFKRTCGAVDGKGPPCFHDAGHDGRHSNGRRTWENKGPERIPDNKLLTTHEVAALLQTDPATISKWVDKGTLLGYRTPGMHRRVLARDVRAMAQKHGMYLPPELA